MARTAPPRGSTTQPATPPANAAAKPATKRRAATAPRRPPERRAGPRPEPTLRILETRVLRGPNYWAREPVVRMLVDLGVLEQFPSNLVPGFTDAHHFAKLGMVCYGFSPLRLQP